MIHVVVFIVYETANCRRSGETRQRIIDHGGCSAETPAPIRPLLWCSGPTRRLSSMNASSIFVCPTQTDFLEELPTKCSGLGLPSDCDQRGEGIGMQPMRSSVPRTASSTGKIRRLEKGIVPFVVGASRKIV